MQFCFYCHEKGATIGCCAKACRRSFHLPCALEHDCRLEFTNTFRSFCDLHHNIKEPKNVHKPTDLCTVCYDDMGEYNPIRSIPLPCCNKNSWCHKFCLQKYAQTSGYFLKCPLCKDEKLFRDWISQRGVFIPDRYWRLIAFEISCNKHKNLFLISVLFFLEMQSGNWMIQAQIRSMVSNRYQYKKKPKWIKYFNHYVFLHF